MIRRYKRFLADVSMRDGSEVTVHCPNPGAMTGLADPGTPMLLSHHPGTRRKLAWSWELARAGDAWVCVNTAIANKVVAAWIEAGTLFPELGPARAEVRYGDSRLDFRFFDGSLLEVKSVTLMGEAGVAAFPDAKTERGRRHVETLAAAGDDPGVKRRLLLFFVARSDAVAVRPADEIDPKYGAALRAAVEAGVEVHAVRADFGPDGVTQGPFLDVLLDPR